MIEEAQHLGCGRPDMALQLDLRDVCFGDDEAELTAVDACIHGRIDEAVTPVAVQDGHARGLDARGGHGGTCQACHHPVQAGLTVSSGVLH